MAPTTQPSPPRWPESARRSPAANISAKDDNPISTDAPTSTSAAINPTGSAMNASGMKNPFFSDELSRPCWTYQAASVSTMASLANSDG